VKLIQSEFIKKANLIHNNKYNYSNVVYLNTEIKVEIICPIHGSFYQTPHAHIGKQKQGCKKCGIEKRAKNQRYSFEDFICMAKIIFENKFEYIEPILFDFQKKISIICPIHGELKQTPVSHLNYSEGCAGCGRLVASNKVRSSKEEFVEKANLVHKHKFTYNDVVYKTVEDKVFITCSIHGNFEQTPHSHLSGKGCYKCRYSYGEKIIKNFLEEEKINFSSQHKFDGCKNKLKLPFDFYLPEYNLCIEYDGIQHFECIEFFGGKEGFKKRQIHDQIKNEYCKKNNINLIRIKKNEDITKIINQFIKNNI
jgi:very-short-patch-repair endonuclease